MSTLIPKLTPGQLAALKLHNIELIPTHDEYKEPMVILSKNQQYLASWEYSRRQWDVRWDDDIDKNIQLLDSILGPNSAY